MLKELGKSTMEAAAMEKSCEQILSIIEIHLNNPSKKSKKREKSDLSLFFDLQSTREFFIDKKISIEPKKDTCHHEKNNNFIESLSSLDQHQDHHHC